MDRGRTHRTAGADLFAERKVGPAVFTTLATVVALFGGETVAGALVVVMVLTAEFVTDLSTDRARASIQALIRPMPQVVIVREGSAERRVSVGDLKVGDVVLVRAGETIPVDGTVVWGSGAVHEASVTGGCVPKDKAAGAAVFAGTVVESGALDVRAARRGSDTLFARTIALAEQPEPHHAKVAQLADQVASWLLPADLVLLVVAFVVTHNVRTIVTLTIVTTPVQLGLATALVAISAIARGAQNGILIKGGPCLESLARADVFVFDKTGTLTVGRPQLIRVLPEVRPGLDEGGLLRLAAAAARRSGHPLARAIVEHAGKAVLEVPKPETFEFLQSRGVKATVEGREVLVGNAALLRDHGVVPPKPVHGQVGTVVFVAVARRAVGRLIIGDQPRPGAKKVVARLKATGVRRVIMLTGDKATIAQAVATALGVEEVQAELTREGKVKGIRALQAQGHRVAMVGDGVNDGPALARADVGIAMGSSGTQAVLEAADVALVTDDLSTIVFARALARRAYRTIQQNLFVGVGVVHAVGITAALLGLIGPFEAVIIHLGSGILVLVNSVRLLRVRIE